MTPAQDGWPEFTQKSPVKIKQLKGSNIDSFNNDLERDIKDAGDRLKGTTAAKCYMTQWDMHKHYPSFEILGNLVIDLAKTMPMAVGTNEDGTPRQYALRIEDFWSLIYSKDISVNHTNIGLICGVLHIVSEDVKIALL